MKPFQLLIMYIMYIKVYGVFIFEELLFMLRYSRHLNIFNIYAI